MYQTCEFCKKIFLSKSSYLEHLKDCDPDDRDETEDELLSVSSATSYNVEKLISNKNSLREELKKLMSKYEKKKIETSELKKQMEELAVEKKKFEDDLKAKYGEILGMVEEKKETMKDKENKLRERDDRLREREGKIKEKEERFVYQEKMVSEREDRVRESEQFLKQREDRVYQSENRVRELEMKIDAMQQEHRQLLYNIDQEKGRIGMQIANMSNEKEMVRQQTLKMKDVEIEKMLLDKNTAILDMKSTVEQNEKKMSKVIEETDKVVADVRVETELQLQKMRNECMRMRSDYEKQMYDMKVFYSSKMEQGESKLKNDMSILSADYESKLKQKDENYQRVIETLQGEYNKKNKEFNDNMISLRSDLEFYKKSLTETISKKETEVKADATQRYYELKMEYEKQLNILEQESRAKEFSFALKEKEYEDRIASVERKLEESKTSVISMNAALSETSKKYEQKLVEENARFDKNLKEQKQQIQVLEEEISRQRKEMEVRAHRASVSQDELMKNIKKEKQEKELLLASQADMKADVERKLSAFRDQVDNASDKATNKIEEARLGLEKQYRERIAALEDEVKTVRTKYTTETSQLYQKISFLNLEFKTLEASTKRENDEKIKTLLSKHSEEMGRLMSKNNAEIQLFRSECTNLKSELDNHKRLFETTVTSKLNDQKAQLMTEFADELEKVNGVLFKTQQEFYNYKKTSIETLNNQRSSLLEDKKKELSDLETRLTKELDKQLDASQREINNLREELAGLGKKKDDEKEKACNHLLNEIDDYSSRLSVCKQEFEAKIVDIQRFYEKKMQEKEESLLGRMKDETEKLRKHNNEQSSKYNFEIRKLLQEIEMMSQSKQMEINSLQNSVVETEKEVDHLKKTLDDYKLFHAETVKRISVEKEKMAIENKQRQVLEEKLKTKDEQLNSSWQQISLLSEENMMLKTQKHQEIENLQKEKNLILSEKQQDIRMLEETLKQKFTDQFSTLKHGYEETIAQLIQKNQVEHVKLDHDKRIASLIENFNLEKRALTDSISATFLQQINELKDKLATIEFERKQAVQRLEETSVDKNIYLNETQLLKTKLLEMESLRKIIDDQKAQLDKLNLTCSKLTELNEKYIKDRSEIQSKLDQTVTLNEIFKQQIKLTANKDEYKKTVDKLIVENLTLKQTIERLNKK